MTRLRQNIDFALTILNIRSAETKRLLEDGQARGERMDSDMTLPPQTGHEPNYLSWQDNNKEWWNRERLMVKIHKG
jgi:hypothetical protein